MKKIYEISTCKKELIEKNDYEYVNVISEYNPVTDYKPACLFKAETVKHKLLNYLNLTLKDCFCFTIVCIVDTVGRFNNLTKTIIFINSKEITDELLLEIKEKIESDLNNVEIIVSEKKPEKKTITSFENKCQEWANEIQKYLTNYFKFYGITKINAFRTKNNLEFFDIIASGKGTNDVIVDKLKLLSEEILKENCLECSQDYKFSLIQKYFES